MNNPFRQIKIKSFESVADVILPALTVIRRVFYWFSISQGRMAFMMAYPS